MAVNFESFSALFLALFQRCLRTLLGFIQLFERLRKLLEDL